MKSLLVLLLFSSLAFGQINYENPSCSNFNSNSLVRGVSVISDYEGAIDFIYTWSSGTWALCYPPPIYAIVWEYGKGNATMISPNFDTLWVIEGIDTPVYAGIDSMAVMNSPLPAFLKLISLIIPHKP